MPWLVIKPVTLWFPGRHSIHWATPGLGLVLFCFVLFCLIFLFTTNLIFMLENTFFSYPNISIHGLSVSRTVDHLLSLYLKVALQGGIAFGGRNHPKVAWPQHSSHYVDFRDISSWAFDAFSHLMFPQNITRKRKVPPAKPPPPHTHCMSEGESEAKRNHWAQIPRPAGPGHDPSFFPPGPWHVPYLEKLPEGLGKCTCCRSSCFYGCRFTSVA